MWRLGYLTWATWQYTRLLGLTMPVLGLVYLAVGPDSGWFWLGVLLVGLAVAGLRWTLRDFLRWETTGTGWRR